MYAGGETFLISVSSPLELIINSHVKKLDREHMGRAVQSQLALLQSRGFVPRRIKVDPQRSLVSIKDSFPGIEIDVSGAGDHLNKVDAKVRRIKETMRSVIAGLPFRLPKDKMKDLVTFTVSRLNTRRTKGLPDNVCPRVKFTGRKVLYKREYGLAFGDYVEAYNPRAKLKSSDVQTMRTKPCVALYPSANINGSWVMWNLMTNTYVRRLQWRRMTINDVIIDKINRYADKNELSLEVADWQSPPEEGEEDADENKPVVHRPMLQDVVPMSAEEAKIDEEEPESAVIETVAEQQHEGVSEHSTVIEAGSTETSIAQQRERRTTAGQSSRYSEQEYTLMNLSVKKAIKLHGAVAKDAVKKELVQMFKEKKVLVVVKWHDIPRQHRKSIIRSHMFLKEKYDAAGEFEKMKSRLVGDGRMQDRELYESVASPTASPTTTIIVLKVAAVERRLIGKYDVGGAYLNAFMDDADEVYMELSPELVALILELWPELKVFVHVDGKLYVRVQRALYGLIQSALLWYLHLTEHLKRLGFVQNEHDQCVYNMMRKGKEITVVIYVDDLLVTTELQENMDWMTQQLRDKYKEVSHEQKDKMSYLGMVVEREADHIALSMTNYIKETLKIYGKDVRKVATPGKLDMYDKEPSVEKSANKELFHTVVARLLYLGKRTRADILTAVQHLCTRVNDARKSDDKKLERILGYLKSTMHKKKIISNQGFTRVEGMIDAAYGCHADGKSQTGCTIQIGGTSVMDVSRKQKIVSKDSTEAELVALSDMVLDVLQVHYVLEGQGLKLSPPLLHQDNQATITLVTKGGGRSRTKHMKVRQHMVKEMYDNEEVSIQYTKTTDMIVDVLTKPLGGPLHYKLTSLLLGQQPMKGASKDKGALVKARGSPGVHAKSSLEASKVRNKVLSKNRYHALASGEQASK
jgi:Reverse transcriptase (RNA-dependent DNA polymerase)